MTEESKERELRSYGRRRGRKRSPHQEALLRDLLPRVSVDLASATPPALGGRLPAGESPGATQVWLEIGFGGGEHLVWQARANPAVRFIGCEPFEDGVVKVLSAIASEGLGNICLHMGDARDVLRWLQPASIDRAFILFPDPWPKRKHQKRRLVNPATLDMLARVMRSGAELRFGTDIGDYARSALTAFAAEPRFVWQADGPADWRVRPGDWPETRYEAKAVREGRRRYYFRFRRV
jgi:tRNA (guanine-N7-)-methyltransferase